MNTILLASLLSLTGTHQGGDTLYRPGISLKDQSISLRSWGSGICSETEEDAFEGSTSVRVTTRNLFQGGILTWERPVDLAGSFNDKANLLRITFKSLDGTVNSTGGGSGAGKGASGGGPTSAGGAGAGGGGSLGGFDSGGDTGKGGQNKGGGGAPSTVTLSTLKMMRIITATTDGKKSEAYIPASTTVSVDRGWKQAGIPLQAIKGFDKTNKIVKNISFSGDVSTAFYLGDIRVINDRTPIRAETTFKTAVCALNDSLTFSARGYGGSSVLKYSWDFDDADGIQADAEGATVKFRFRTSSNDLKNPSTMRPNGEFTITLTVSDTYGLKEPYVTTIKVKVNP